MGVRGCRALLKFHLRLGAVDNLGGVKKRIFNAGASWGARDRARCERASATVFFFPWIKKTWRSILNSRRIFTDEKIMGLYKEMAWRELKMLRRYWNPYEWLDVLEAD